MCAYIPTVKPPSSIKLKFYDDLLNTKDKIQHNGILVMLDDLNARLGMLGIGYDIWKSAIGEQGLNKHNLVSK